MKLTVTYPSETTQETLDGITEESIGANFITSLSRKEGWVTNGTYLRKVFPLPPVLTAVTISSNNANPIYAKVGDTITVTFTADKTIYNPEVEIAGHVLTATQGYNNTWTATYTMTGEDLEGVIGFKISNYREAWGEIGNIVEETSDNSSVAFIKTLPVMNITYSTTAPTNQDVTATLNLAAGITVTNNEGSNIVTFTDNGTFAFEFTDVAGNTGTLNATVNNIDKIAPTATVEYSITSWTNQDVMATITPNETVTITNNGGSNTLIFTSNGNYTFHFVDLVGNAGFLTVDVGNIDKQAPNIGINGNPTTWQNTNATLTCNITEELSGVAIKKYGIGQKDIAYFNGGIIGNDLEIGDTITVTNNTWITVYAKDNAGNETVEQVEITKIDKAVPTITLSHNPTTPANGNITITAITDGTGSDISGTKWATGSQDIEYFTNNGTAFTNTFIINDNGTYTIYAKDVAGNEKITTYTISNIDTILPALSTVTISSNNANPAYAKVGDIVTVTFIADKKIYNPEVEIAGHVVTAIEGSNDTWTAEYTMVDTDLEGVVSFKISNYQDEASNIGVTVEGTTDNSEVEFLKTLPAVHAIYSTEEPTTQDVQVTLVIPSNITILNNEGNNILTFTSNGTYTFEYIDVAGNIGTFTVEVDNIISPITEEKDNQESEIKNEATILGITIPKLGESIVLYVGIMIGLSILIVVVVIMKNRKKDNEGK